MIGAFCHHAPSEATTASSRRQTNSTRSRTAMAPSGVPMSPWIGTYWPSHSTGIRSWMALSLSLSREATATMAPARRGARA